MVDVWRDGEGVDVVGVFRRGGATEVNIGTIVVMICLFIPAAIVSLFAFNSGMSTGTSYSVTELMSIIEWYYPPRILPAGFVVCKGVLDCIKMRVCFNGSNG